MSGNLARSASQALVKYL